MKINTHMKINIKFLLYVLIAIIFVKPRYFEEFDILDNIMNALKVMCGMLILYEYICRNNFKISKFFGIQLIFWIILFCSTIINQADILRAIMYSLVNLSIVAIVELSIKENNFFRLDAFFIAYFMMIIINFLGLLFFPDGLYLEAGDRGNFLNIDNLLGHILIITIMLSTINIEQKRYYKISVTNFIICILTVIITWSATALVSVGCLLFLIILRKNKFISEIVTTKVLLIVYVIFFTIVILNGNRTFLNNFVTEVLKKDLTFSGRTYVWNEFFDKINNKEINIIIGNGIRNTNQIFSEHFGVLIHLHNQFYNIIYEGGIISLVTYIYIIIISSKNLSKKSKNDNYTKTIISSTVFAFLIFMTLEINRNLDYLTLLFSYSYYSTEIANFYNIEKKVKDE